MFRLCSSCYFSYQHPTELSKEFLNSTELTAKELSEQYWIYCSRYVYKLTDRMKRKIIIWTFQMMLEMTVYD